MYIQYILYIYLGSYPPNMHKSSHPQHVNGVDLNKIKKYRDNLYI